MDDDVQISVINNSDMICFDCKFKGNRAGICAKYPDVKPLSVVVDKKCKFKEVENVRR